MMSNRLYQNIVAAAGLALLLNSTGCSSLPGEPKTQGAVIGGVGGAAAGAAIGGKEHRALGALIGGALGAGGGYVIGANSDKITGKDSSGAQQATQSAQTQPATAQQARTATTADLNSDGFVTLDEVVAMHQAGIPDQEMLRRLQITGQVFELTAEQQKYLIDRGVSSSVVSQMQSLNKETRNQLLNQQPSGVISHPQ
jgi:hypothetical protein